MRKPDSRDGSEGCEGQSRRKNLSAFAAFVRTFVGFARILFLSSKFFILSKLLLLISFIRFPKIFWGSHLRYGC